VKLDGLDLGELSAAWPHVTRECIIKLLPGLRPNAPTLVGPVPNFGDCQTPLVSEVSLAWYDTALGAAPGTLVLLEDLRAPNSAHLGKTFARLGDGTELLLSNYPAIRFTPERFRVLGRIVALICWPEGTPHPDPQRHELAKREASEFARAARQLQRESLALGGRGMLAVQQGKPPGTVDRVKPH